MYSINMLLSSHADNKGFNTNAFFPKQVIKYS
jgi:hypothetical protein